MEETTVVKNVLIKLKSSLPICRVCLDISMEYIEFEAPLCVVNNREITYAEGFLEIAPDVTELTEKELSNFCVDCGRDLLNAYLFTKRVENANLILNKTKNFVEESSNSNSLKEEEQSFSDMDSSNSANFEIIETHKNDFEADYAADELEEVSSNNVSIIFKPENEKNVKKEELEYQNLCAYEMSLKNDFQNEDLDRVPKRETNTAQSEDEMETTEWILKVSGADECNEEEILSDDFAKNCFHCEKLIPNEELETHLLLHEYSKSALSNSDEETHQCKLCEYSSKKLLEFLNHIEIHTESKPQICDICTNTFDSNIALAFHKLRVHGETKKKRNKEYTQCKHCKKVVQRSLMCKHLKNHSLTDKFSCFSCEEPFPTKIALKEHSEIHKTNQFTCNICGKICLKSSTLIKHIQYIHLSERRKYQCEECGLFFQFPSYLKDHRRKHDTETRFQCSQCDRSFCRKPQLDIHMRYHKNDFPYKCESCEKCYATKSNLVDHIKSKHTKTTFDCDKCNQKFKSQTGLRKHKYTHDGYPYTCPICNVGQTSRSGLKTHLLGVHKDAVTEEEFNEKFPIIVPKTGFRRPKDK